MQLQTDPKTRQKSTKTSTYFPPEIWRRKNLLYYQDIERLYRFYVKSASKVLEIGSGTGYLLASIDPEYGLGIDLNSQAVEYARSHFPSLDFCLQDGESYTTEEKFDYILLANTVSYLQNLHKTFDNLRHCSNPNTRLVLTFHNPGWELILKIATLLKQRTPIDNLNWLSYEDINNILHLHGFEVICHHKQMLLPRRIMGLSWLCNKIIAQLPFINQLCLTESIIARPKLNKPHQVSEQQTLTCSVIIPARNEAGNIESCVTRMPQLGQHTEIIFIEGHSQDNTWEEIKRVQAKYGHQWDIKIAQQSDKGKGDAVRQGFAMATGDILMILDSDLTVRPEDLTHFFDAVASGSCEFANGCRLVYPIHPQAMPWLNRMANRFFAWLLSYLLGIKIKDSLCGTKVLFRHHYQQIAENRSYFGDFDPFGDFDLLFGAAKLGLEIKDVPVRYDPRSYGSSNIQHFKEGIVLLKMCLFAAQKIKFR